MPFLFEDRNEVRTIRDELGNIWFVAKDIILALDYSKFDSNLISKIPDEWKDTKPIRTLGGDQNMAIISEQGLYFFIGRSDKPKALPFQKWLAGEVLPSIRKTGNYSILQNKPQASETQPKQDEHENKVFPQMEFVFMVNNKLRVSHCYIAEEIDYDEKLIRNTITKHFEYLQKYGEVYFESEPRINSAGAINYKKIYFLNEQQSSSLFNYIRNSDKVEKFKAILIKEFSEKREKILLSNLTRIQNSKSFDFASLEDLGNYVEYNKKLIDLIKLISNQENNTLIYLDKVSKNLNYKSAVELLEIKL